MRIGAVELTARREVVLRVQIECARLVGVRKLEQLPPVIRRERPLLLRQHPVRDGPVAREDSAPEKIVGIGIDRKLEVAVQEALIDPLGEDVHAGDPQLAPALLDLRHDVGRPHEDDHRPHHRRTRANCAGALPCDGARRN